MLSTVLGLNLQLERDRARTPEELRARDRAIGRDQKLGKLQGLRALRVWLDAVQTGEDARRAAGSTLALRSVGWLLAALGLFAGVGAAAAIYRYDGSHPVNILPALAAFVFLPLLLLPPLVVSLLPDAIVRRAPGLAAIRRLLSIFGVGLMALATRLLPQSRRQDLEFLVGRGRAGWKVFGGLQRWTVMSWSQGFAVTFHLGAIGWFVLRVFVTDLSFTWSTTVEAMTPERVHALTQTLAAPWRGWLPDAVPALADVRATQYFRLGDGSVAGTAPSLVDPAALGRWWTFLLACMLSYGFLPRVLAWGWCRIRRRHAARWTALHLPGVADVLDRLESSLVLTRSVGEPEAAGGRSPDPEPAEEGAAAVTRAVVVEWAGAAGGAQQAGALVASRWGTTVLGTHAAGVSLAEDERVVVEVGSAVRSAPDRSAAVVLVKAWEPATLDCLDFLRDLRGALPEGMRIVVAALERGGPGERPADLLQWRHRVAAAGDPWSSVHALAPRGVEGP